VSASKAPEQAADRGQIRDRDKDHDLRIPIVVGVTGHRNLNSEDTPALREMVRAVLEEVLRKLPNSPLVLMSPLAEGADRLVAQVALELADDNWDSGGHSRIRLVVPLPMPQSEYERDFNNDRASLNAFRKLLSSASFHYVLPMVAGNNVAKIENRHDNPYRDLQYRQAGVHVAQSSDVLIALWDGHESSSDCGTARMVEWKSRGIPDEYANRRSNVHRRDSGLVTHIVTPRQGRPRPKRPLTFQAVPPPKWSEQDHPKDALWRSMMGQLARKHTDAVSDVKFLPLRLAHLLLVRALYGISTFHENVARSVLSSKLVRAINMRLSAPFRLGRRTVSLVKGDVVFVSDFEKAVLRALKNVDAFNGAMWKTRSVQHKIVKSVNELLPEAEQLSLALLSQRLLARYGLADAIANGRQNGAKLASVGIVMLALLAVASFECFAHVGFLKLYATFVVYPFSLIAALALSARARRIRAQCIDYRAIAEALRVKFFWSIAGIDEDLSYHCLQKQGNEIDWICSAVRSWSHSGLLAGQGKKAVLNDARLDMVRTFWVFDRACYFANGLRRNRIYITLYERASALFVVAGIALAINLIWGAFHRVSPETGLAPHLWAMLKSRYVLTASHEGCLALSAIFPAVGVAIYEYAKSSALATDGRRYSTMSGIFLRALHQLTSVDARKYEIGTGTCDVIRSLGSEALKDIGDWVIARRERWLDVPMA